MRIPKKYIDILLEKKYWLLQLFRQYKSRKELLNFWKNPSTDNLPEQYLKGKERTLFLVKLVNKYCRKSFSVLEIGCNIGRNLYYLRKSGFNKLSGIEPNIKAIQLMRKKFEDTYKSIKLFKYPVESKIKKFNNSQLDLIFTMAVLEHIHPDSEWIFREMARVAGKYLITIENEKHYHWRTFVRNYKKIFEKLGFVQIEEINCREIDGLGETYFARVFKKIN